MIARAGPEFRGNPAALLEHAQELIGEAEAAGTYVETNYGTVYRVGQTYLVVKDAVLTSFVPNAEAGRGIVTSYIAHGGK
jgi:Tfp pilus assembly protein PilP